MSAADFIQIVNNGGFQWAFGWGLAVIALWIVWRD